MMDELVFAVEENEKHVTMGFLYEYAKANGVAWYYSVHELDLSETYSDYTVLFQPDGPPSVGLTAELHRQKNLEIACEAPYHMLKRHLSRIKVQMR